MEDTITSFTWLVVSLYCPNLKDHGSFAPLMMEWLPENFNGLIYTLVIMTASMPFGYNYALKKWERKNC